MAEYFTSCRDDNTVVQAVIGFLQQQGHTIVRTIRDDVISQIFDEPKNRLEEKLGLPGTDGRVVIHSTK